MEKNPNLHREKNSETPKLLRKLEKGDPNKSKIFHMKSVSINEIMFTVDEGIV